MGIIRFFLLCGNSSWFSSYLSRIYYMKHTSIAILSYALLATVALYLAENIFHPTYGFQMMQKIALFLLIPVGLGYFFREKLGVFGRWTKDSWIYGMGFWLLSVWIISITYFLLRESIDWQAIHESMEARHITESTFILVFAYIMFGNSLLEEYFFRWVIFQNMRKYSRLWAYIGSALMFSLYHMTIFRTWFAWYILARENR